MKGHCRIEINSFPVTELLTDLGWETLQSRRNKHKLVLLYKILHGLAPDYLSELVPPLVQETTTYNLRNSDNVQNYRAHSNLFLNSFFPSSIRAWNDLPHDYTKRTFCCILQVQTEQKFKCTP